MKTENPIFSPMTRISNNDNVTGTSWQLFEDLVIHHEGGKQSQRGLIQDKWTNCNCNCFSHSVCFNLYHLDFSVAFRVFGLMSFLIWFRLFFFVQMGQDLKEEKKQQMREFFRKFTPPPEGMLGALVQTGQRAADPNKPLVRMIVGSMIFAPGMS